jgi:hypothetical protein
VFVVLTGVLNADAALREAGVSLSVDVLAVDWNPARRPELLDPQPRRPELLARASDNTAPSTLCARPVRGGVLLTVGGGLAQTLSGQWRAAGFACRRSPSAHPLRGPRRAGRERAAGAGRRSSGRPERSLVEAGRGGAGPKHGGGARATARRALPRRWEAGALVPPRSRRLSSAIGRS